MAEVTVTLETPPEVRRVPLVQNQRSLSWISDAVSEIVETRTPLWWWLAFLITSPSFAHPCLYMHPFSPPSA